jgi:hypothetical protein
MKKDELDWGDISGDPKDMKQIRRSRSVVIEDMYGSNEDRYREHASKSSVSKIRRIPAPTGYIESPQSPKVPRRQIRPGLAIQTHTYRNNYTTEQDDRDYDDRRYNNYKQYDDNDRRYNNYKQYDGDNDCNDSSCKLLPVNKNIDYTICPICSKNYVQTCKCKNHDSVCQNGHKWHVFKGKIKLGHSH